jgi:hypothetical protein
MTTQIIQEIKYKACTINCLAYKHSGDYGCKKGNFVFQPPLGKRCTFGLLEGQMEQSSRRETEPKIIDFQKVREVQEQTIREERYERISHLADHLL